MDLNVQTFHLVQEAVGIVVPKRKKVSSRKGGLIGGPARARAISQERRREIAKKASEARWSRTEKSEQHAQ